MSVGGPIATDLDRCLQAWGEGLDGREQQLLGNLVGLAAAGTQAE